MSGRILRLAWLGAALGWFAGAADVRLGTEPYARAGLFCAPLIPQVGEAVTITVRATVEGTLDRPVPAAFVLTDQAGKVVLALTLKLTTRQGLAEAALSWTPERNGPYRATVRLDPDGTLGQADRKSGPADLLIPVTAKGRKLFFPWFAEREWLRWANLWGGGVKEENVARWGERGVLGLRWKWGVNLPAPEGDKTASEVERFYQMYLDAGGGPGIAIDEFGYYPTPGGGERFNQALAGLAKAKREKPAQFVLAWHCGTLYPEQAALYRDATDLVVIESYVFLYAPDGLKTENIYDVLDMKMRPARQVDALAGPPASATTFITSVDLAPGHFERGEFEQVVRHLRREWPEMRGLGIFGGLVQADQPTPEGCADEQFVDRLCYEYFIGPVVTLLPGSVWVTRADHGPRLTAAVSNIGGMDAGPVALEFTDNDRRVGRARALSVPAGDSRLTNRVMLSVPWRPTPGPHRLQARLRRAAGSQVLDGETSTDYFWQDAP